MSAYLSSDGRTMLETIGATQSVAATAQRVIDTTGADLRYEETSPVYRDSAGVLREAVPVNLVETQGAAAQFNALPTGE